MRRLLAGVVLAAVAAGGILLLRSEIMTVHTPQPEGSRTEFVLHAQTRLEPHHLDEMTRGLVSVCRLLVNSELVEASFTPIRQDVFTFAVTPALDEFDLREMRGCLQDTRVQRLKVKVRDVRQVA